MADARTWLYVLCVVGVGAFVVLSAARIVLATPFSGYVLLLGGLTILAGPFSIQIPGRAATVSFSEIFVFTSVVLFGAAPATLTVAIDGLWMSLRQRDRRTHRTLFNVAEPALSTWAAGHVFFFVVAETSIRTGTPDVAGRLAGTLAMAATYFLLNSVLTAGAVAIESGGSIWDLWRHQATYLALNVYAAASLATLLVRTGTGIDLQAIGLVVPLLLLSYAAYKAAATRVDEAQHHMGEVEGLYAATIETLAIAVDAKDQVTHGHIRRVQRHTVTLARRLGVTDATELKALGAAALLHDVGKLAVPDYVLNKPGRLTTVEFERIKQHANIGASILTRVEFPYPVVPIVRSHHEQWNGRGYPDGLVGDAIPLGARILAVVDCFDALTSDRPYRRKLTDADATAILIERRGVMYDSRVVDAFIELLPDLRCGDAEGQPPAHAGGASVACSTRREMVTDADDDRVTTRALRQAGYAAAASVARLLPKVACGIFVPALSGDYLVPTYASASVRDWLLAAPLQIGEGLSGWVAANRHTIVNSHADLDLGDTALRLGLTACTSTPIFALGDLAGVFTVYTPRPLTTAETLTIGRLGQDIGLQVARAREASADASERLAVVA